MVELFWQVNSLLSINQNVRFNIKDAPLVMALCTDEQARDNQISLISIGYQTFETMVLHISYYYTL